MEVIEMIKPNIINGLDLTFSSFLSSLFEEKFEMIILEIQTKYSEDKNVLQTELDPQKQRIELLEKNNLNQEQSDMWND